MKILISPAKTVREGSALYQSLPFFSKEAERIFSELSLKDTEELMKIWQCSEKIALANQKRTKSTELLMPAIERYTGLQYRNFSYASLDEAGKNYVHEHVRILSSMFGILKPLDGIPSYRLDFHSRLKIDGEDLYTYWKDRVYSQLNDSILINLASKEYSDLISSCLKPSDKMVTIVFLNEKGKAQSTMVKQARGKFLRWMSENQVTDIEGLKVFCMDDFAYCKDLSDDASLVFMKSSLQKK